MFYFNTNFFSFKECHIFYMRYLFPQGTERFYTHLCQNNIKLKIINKYINISNNLYEFFDAIKYFFFRIDYYRYINSCLDRKN